jgi:hypothetical protein
MLHHHPVKQRLVPILEVHQVHILLELARFPPQTEQHPGDLFFLRKNRAGPATTPQQPQRIPFRLGEGRAFVQVGIPQPIFNVFCSKPLPSPDCSRTSGLESSLNWVQLRIHHALRKRQAIAQDYRKLTAIRKMAIFIFNDFSCSKKGCPRGYSALRDPDRRPEIHEKPLSNPECGKCPGVPV